MILQNARNVFATFTRAEGNPSGWFKGLSGSDLGSSYIYPNSSYGYAPWLAMCGAYSSYHTYNNGFCYLEVGFGDTAVTLGDYNLDESNADTPKLTCVASGKNSPNGTDLINIFANFRNDGGANVVVKEIGVCGNLNTQGNNGAQYECLLYRKVLDTPVTIAPGETYNFNYRIRIR